MGRLSSDTGSVALAAGAEALAPIVEAAGWRLTDDGAGAGADVRLVDARDTLVQVAREDAAAIAERAALLAIVRDGEGAAQAYDAGATHVLADALDAETLSLALRFAGRHARRLRGTGRARRAGECGDGAVERFVGALSHDHAATVAVIAMSRFDTVNAAFGREAGDALLRETGARIAAALPSAAVIERDEGARFLVAMKEDEPDAAARIATIEAALTRRFAIGAEEANLGVRIGVAHRGPGEVAATLVRRAREALHHALASDGASVRVAPSVHAAHGLRLAADLHRAIDRDEIDILFQPQVALDDGQITGVEALARWEHPGHGVLGADTLFSAAERAGLGLALSEHIQRLALTMAAAWSGRLAGLRVAINVTAADLARGDFVEYFLALVERSGIDPARVTAEVTESGFVTDLELAAERLQRLRDAGLCVAIDDFGTGYSSLAYLKALPLDYLKIDRSLTQDIAGGERARTVVRGVIAIAAGLGLATIAEGVEDEEQRSLLAAEGCTLYQGFLCAGPLRENVLAALVGEA